MSPMMDSMSPMMGNMNHLSPLQLDIGKHRESIDSSIGNYPEATASSTTENWNKSMETIPTSGTITNAPDVAKAIDETGPDICPSNEEKVERMLRSGLRGGKASSKPRPSSHSHSVSSFSPQRSTNQKLHNEQGSGLAINDEEDVGTMMQISDSDASTSGSDPGAPLAVSSSDLRFRRLGHLQDRDARDDEVLLDHRLSFSRSIYPTGAERGDQRMTDPISQFIDEDEATAGTNVNTTTCIAEPVSAKTAKVKKRHHDSDSLVASPIASTLPTLFTSAHPRRTKRVKLNALTEPEDPFENFNSGSEPEDDGDVDFDAPSASPSLRSKSPSPEPTPPDSEDESPVAKEKGKGQRQQAAVKAKEPPKSSFGFGEWPIARRAFRISSTSSSSTVAAAVAAETTKDKSWPLASEALRAANRGVAVSGIPNPTSAGHDHEFSRLHQTRPPPANNNHPIMAENAVMPDAASMDSVIEAEYSTLNAQLRESEKEAEIEKKKLHKVGREVEILKGMIEDDDGIGVEEVMTRNGADWTLIIERDEHGRRVKRWKFG
ncbi:MAG: hypothetical protein Q9200_004970 [Gallowayella weberi]